MKHVGQIGRRAFLGLGVGARVSGCPNIGKGASGDYPVVMRYFGELAGNGGADAAAQVKAVDERRRALWALALVEGEVAEAFGGRGEAARYADALFGKIHRTDRGRATARQIWAVIFTLRNRAAGKRAKPPLGARGAPVAHLPSPEGSNRFPAFSRGLYRI